MERQGCSGLGGRGGMGHRLDSMLLESFSHPKYPVFVTSDTLGLLQDSPSPWLSLQEPGDAPEPEHVPSLPLLTNGKQKKNNICHLHSANNSLKISRSITYN